MKLKGTEEMREPPVRVKPEAEERPPLVLMERPPSRVEVAVAVDRMEPPVIVRPLEDARPAVERPPEKVEVAAPWTVMVEVEVSWPTVVVPAKTD